MLWDVSTGKQIRTFSGHINNIIQVAFSPNGQFGYSACYHEYICIWDLSRGKLVERFGGSNSGSSDASFSSDGRFVAFTGSVCFEEMDKIEETSYIDDDFEMPPELIRFEAAKREKSIRVWDIEKRQEHCRLRTKNEQGRAQQGFYIALNHNATLGISFSNGYTHLWDITKGAEIGLLKNFTSHAHFSPDGRQVLTGSSTHGISLYQVVESPDGLKFVIQNPW